MTFNPRMPEPIQKRPVVASNTSAPEIVLYEAAEPLRNRERWIAWLTEDRAVVDKQGKKTGEIKTVFLPVYFFGESYLDARNRALAFWDDKKAKKAARAERGKKLGRSKAAVGALRQ